MNAWRLARAEEHLDFFNFFYKRKGKVTSNNQNYHSQLGAGR